MVSRKKLFGFGSLVALTLVSCGEDVAVGVPNASDDAILRVSDVVVAAQCELNRAAARQGAEVRFRKAVLTMTMTAVVSEATGGGLTLTIPLAGSSISLERARRPIGSAVRRMDVQIVHDIGASIDCPSADTPVLANGVRLIEGGLGLERWLEEADRVATRTGQLPVEVNYSLGFDIGLTNSFNPVFSRSSDSGVNPDVSPETADTSRMAHRIVVTLLPVRAGRVASEADHLEAAGRYLRRIGPN